MSVDELVIWPNLMDYIEQELNGKKIEDAEKGVYNFKIDNSNMKLRKISPVNIILEFSDEIIEKKISSLFRTGVKFIKAPKSEILSLYECPDCGVINGKARVKHYYEGPDFFPLIIPDDSPLHNSYSSLNEGTNSEYYCIKCEKLIHSSFFK